MSDIPKIIIFDLDGTLAVSKQRLDDEMVKILVELLKKAKIAITSGGKWGQFLKQVIIPLQAVDAPLGNLYIFPTCGGAFYIYRNGKWQSEYEHLLSEIQKKKIIDG